MPSKSSPPNAELIVAFRDAAHRYATAEEPSDREASLSKLTALWARLRDRAEAVGHLSPRFPTVERVQEILAPPLRDEDPKNRSAASTPLVSMFDRLDRSLETAGTPAELATRWRPEKPPLAPAEKDALLRQSRDGTRRTARSMADAIRKVLAARRERGVALYSTFSTEMRAAYAVAATDYALGLVPATPYQPPSSKRTAPWGLFRVRSDVPPAEAAVRFAVSPPLPVRSALLESRPARIRLAPLHPPAPAGDAAAPEVVDADP